MALSSQQQIHFESVDAAGAEKFKPKVTITGHPGMSWGEKGIPYRVYPPGCIVRVTSGSVSLDITREVEVPGDFLQWSGQSASLRYTPNNTPTVTFQWGFDDEGKPVSQVTFTVNRTTGEVRSSKSFQGLVKVGPYRASYQLIWYKPANKLFEMLASSYPTLVEYGVICAYKNGGIAIEQVQLPNIQQDTDRIELWRVTSKTVLDSKGEWEYPSNWGGAYAGKYPDGKTGPDKDASAVKERVHEIGYITATGGSVWYERFPKFLLQPYESPTQGIRDVMGGGFQPDITLSKQDPITLFPDKPAAQGAASLAISERMKLPKIR